MAKSKLEDALMAGLEDALSFEKGRKKLTTSKRRLPKPAPEFNKRSVRKLRNDFDLTQDELAAYLNVKVTTVRSWEQGLREPGSANNRLLQLFKNFPELIDRLAN